MMELAASTSCAAFYSPGIGVVLPGQVRLSEDVAFHGLPDFLVRDARAREAAWASATPAPLACATQLWHHADSPAEFVPMAMLLEYVGNVHIFLGPYRGNPISLYLMRNGDRCIISPKVYPWNKVIGVGETPNKAAADFEEKWKAKGLTSDMYTGPSWEGGIKPERPAPPKPPAAAKPAAAPAAGAPAKPAGAVASPQASDTAPSQGTGPSPAPHAPSATEGPAPAPTPSGAVVTGHVPSPAAGTPPPVSEPQPGQPQPPPVPSEASPAAAQAVPSVEPTPATTPAPAAERVADDPGRGAAVDAGEQTSGTTTRGAPSPVREQAQGTTQAAAASPTSESVEPTPSTPPPAEPTQSGS